MVEFKNTSVMTEKGGLSSPFSLVVDPGDVVCLCGPSGSGKSRLLLAMMGLEPVAQGFITLDGELITPGAGAYFRKMIAYVPQRLPQSLPQDPVKLSELYSMAFASSREKPDKGKLLEKWQHVGIDKSLFDKTLDKINAVDLRTILLSFTLLQRRPIVLIDGVPQVMQAAMIIRELVSMGSEVIYTCRENKHECNKLVNL